MANHILVPLDGSAFAEQALAAAADIARRSGAALELATAYCSQMPAWRTSGAPMHDPRMDQELVGRLKAYLEQTASRVSSELEVPTTGVLLQGAAGEALVKHISERAPALVVLTTHGRGGLSRVWLGSVAEELIRQVDAPMLILRPTESEPAPRFRPRTILVPLDGSERAERMIENAARLSGSDGVRFRLLRVVAPPLGTPYPNVFPAAAAVDEGEAVAAAEDMLHLLCDRLQARGYEVEARAVVEDQVARAILAAAEEGVDLIAMTTYGFDPVRRRHVGTVADKVVRAAKLPVLLRRA